MQDVFGLQAGAYAVAQEGGVIRWVAGAYGCAAAKHLRIGIARREQAAVEVFRPFPNQAVHIVNAPVVGFAFADIAQAVSAAVCIPVKNGTVVAGFGRTVFLCGGGKSGKFPLVYGRQAFALRSTVGIGGKPRYVGYRMFQFVGFGRVAVAAGFNPVFEVGRFGLFGTDFTFLPLGMFFDKLCKFGIGNGVLVDLEGFDFNEVCFFLQIERAVAASFNFCHFGRRCTAACDKGKEGEEWYEFHNGLSNLNAGY